MKRGRPFKVGTEPRKTPRASGTDAMNLEPMNGTDHIVRQQTHSCNGSSAGYALPSVLLLVTILSLVAAAVITLASLERRLAMEAVFRAKAGYAAESGVAALLADLRTMNQLRERIGRSPSQFFFPDGSEAGVTVEPWGLLFVVRSEGICNGFRLTRTALAADTPPSMFDHALLFGNNRHQLVFAGDARVRGSVVVGPHGAGTGSLPGRGTPMNLPVDGSVREEPSARVPDLRSFALQDLVTAFKTQSEGRGVFDTRSHRSTGRVVSLPPLPDSVQNMFVDGDLNVGKVTVTRRLPLRLFVRGDVVIGEDTELRGLVSIAAGGTIRVEAGSYLEHVILFSRTAITLDPSVQAIAQLIAPRIEVGERASLRYPSMLLSVPFGSEQRVRISREARVEGLVALLAADSIAGALILEEQSTVLGAILAQGVMTLDGRVAGSVLTSDFFFRHEQTDYYGWLRTGSIDRTTLPKGFLVPPGFSHTVQLMVLDWI